MESSQNCKFVQHVQLNNILTIHHSTTTSLTSTFAAHLATLLGLSPDNTTINLVLRAIFFGLNLLFDGVMWALFTAALTRADSTTRVSVINVSANFIITALFGWAIFGEKLPVTWWMGAGLLATGNMIIGRREEDSSTETGSSDGPEARPLMTEVPQAGPVHHTDSRVRKTRYSDEESRLNRGEEIDAPI